MQSKSDRMSAFDTGQARIPEVAHQMQGAQHVVSLQIASQGASASATTAHDISRATTDTDSIEINTRSTDTTHAIDTHVYSLNKS